MDAIADVQTATYRAVADFSQLRKEASSGEDALDRVGRAADKAGSDTAKGMGAAAGGIGEVAEHASVAERVVKGFGSAVVSAGGAIASAFGHAVVAGVQAVGTALAVGGAAAAGFVVHAVMVAARVDELNGVLAALARVSGVSYEAMQQQVAGIRASGIEANVAQGLVATLVRANIDLSQATTLARVAQDAAVFSGQNSSDVLAQLTDGIETQNTLILRNAGLQVDVNEALDIYAKKLGIAKDDLTGAQRQQAVMNAVLLEGEKIAGSYAAAMESPSKVLRSLQRVFNDVAVNVGQVFLPVFGDLIFSAYAVGKGLTAATLPGQPLAIILTAIAEVVRGLIAPLIDLGKRFTDAISHTTVDRANQIAEAIRNVSPAVLALLAGLVVLGGSGLPIIGQFVSPWMAVAAAVGVFVLKSEAAQEALAPLLKMFRDMGERVMPLLTGIIQRLTPIIESIIFHITAYGHILVEAFERFINVVGPTLNLIFEVLGRTIEKLIPVIFPLIAVVLRVASAIIDVLGEAIAAALPIVVKLAEAVGPLIEQLGEMFVDALYELLPLVVDLFDELRKSGIIGTLAEMFGKVFDALTPLIPVLADLAKDILKKVMEVLPPIVEAFGELVDALLPLVPPLTDVAKAFADLLTPLIPIAGHLLADVLGLLADLIEPLAKCEPLVYSIAAAFALWKLNMALGAVYDFAILLQTRLIPNLIESAAAAWANVAPFLAMAAPILLVTAAVLGIAAGIYFLWTEWDKIWNWIKDHKALALIILAMNPLVVIIGGVIIALKLLLENWRDIWNWIKEAFSDTVDWIKQAATDVKDWIVQAFQDVLDFVKGVPGSIKDFFVGLPGKIIEAIGDLLGAWTGLWQRILDWISGVPGKIKDFFVGLPGLIMGVLVGLPGMWFDLGAKMAKMLLSGLGDIVGKIAGIAGAIADKVAGAFGGLFGGIDDKVAELKRKVADAAADAAVLKRAAEVESRAPDYVAPPDWGYTPPSAPADPGSGTQWDDAWGWYARGGIVTAAQQMALLHGPEVVIPLNDPGRALQLAEASGLMGLLAHNVVSVQGSAAPDLPTPSSPLGGMSPTFHIYETEDPEVTADITLRRLTMAVNRS